MKIALFGATGATGQLLLERALERGHDVTALVRTPAKLTRTHERLRVLQGDVTNPTDVEKAVAGQHAVLSAIGSAQGRKPTTLYSDGIRHILAAMERQQVRRLLCISAGGAHPGKDPHAPWFLTYIVKPFIVREVFKDMARMEELVMRHPSEWTIVRPSRLVNAPATGRYRREETHCIQGGNKLSRADLAAFMVHELEAGEYIRKGVAVAY